MQYHANAKLTVRARREVVERMQAGWSATEIAQQMNVSRTTVYKWWARWRVEGDAGLGDRSSRPRRCPHRTDRRLERRIAQLRRTRTLGPARIAGILDLHASTVHRVLCRPALNRLAWMDRPTGRVIRRIETSRPGELVHIDTKKLSRVPLGGGWRAHGWETRSKNRSTRRIRLRPPRDRRLQPSRVQRDPPRRGPRLLHRVPPTRHHVVRRDRGPGRTRPHRQRRRIPQPRVARRLPRNRHHPHPHPALHPPHQRQGRTVQPHAARRMGLRPELPLRQPSPLPHRARRPTTHEPPQQRTRAQQLARSLR